MGGEKNKENSGALILTVFSVTFAVFLPFLAVESAAEEMERGVPQPIAAREGFNIFFPLMPGAPSAPLLREPGPEAGVL